MNIIKGSTSETGKTAYYTMTASGNLSATVLVGADGHAWCAKCPAKNADCCKHVIAIQATINAPQRAARAAIVLARMGWNG